MTPARAVWKELAERSLYDFVRLMWPIVEPATEMTQGRAMEAICQHLEAVADGRIKRLIINVPPGCSKSLLCNVFFPAWIWGPQRRPATRYISASYSSHLTERDNERCLRVMLSSLYQSFWGDVVKIEKTGVTKIGTQQTGWKLATSVGGVGTGERADIVLIDDANNVRESESAVVRDATNMWLTEVIPTRLSDPSKSAIINIQQRTNEQDATGRLLEFWTDYCHLMLPMRYDPQRHCETQIGFSDWREVDGELLWPERFPDAVVRELERMGTYAAAGQLQQSPIPRGGGIVQRDWWRVWPPRGEEERWTTDGHVRFPAWELVIAYLDTAFTSKEENAWCAYTRWGVFEWHSAPKVMLAQAWRDRPTLRGLVDRVVDSCRRGKVDVLVIENRAGAEWVKQEIQRLMRDGEWSIVLDEPRGDKVARLHSVTPLFEDGVIHAPDRQWADMVIDEVGSFPKGRWADLTDTVSGALGYLRRNGLIKLVAEHREDERDALTWRGRRESVADAYGV